MNEADYSLRSCPEKDRTKTKQKVFRRGYQIKKLESKRDQAKEMDVQPTVAVEMDVHPTVAEEKNLTDTDSDDVHPTVAEEKNLTDTDSDESAPIPKAVFDANDDLVSITQVDKPKVIAAAEPKKKMKLSGSTLAEEPEAKKVKKDLSPESSLKKKAAAVPKEKYATDAKVKVPPKLKGEKKPKAATKQKNDSDIDEILCSADEPEASSGKSQSGPLKGLNFSFDSDEDDNGSDDYSFK